MAGGQDAGHARCYLGIGGGAGSSTRRVCGLASSWPAYAWMLRHLQDRAGSLGYSGGRIVGLLRRINADIASGNNNFYIDIECDDNDNNDIIDRGNNGLNINNECDDKDNNDIINSCGDGNNTKDDADKNNNNDINNNDNNQFEDIKCIEDVNYSFFEVPNDNCGHKIDKKEIDDNNGVTGIVGVADNDSTNNIQSNDSHGYGDEAKEDMEINRGCSGAFRTVVWQRMGVG
ncbi:hypothetical protein CBR_g23872 [Chara braunii]|uniref:Uncharacterized protein n=1 Tax=Chara braunii TaxID=69332 RepID=A0A388L5F1_CHABU|nr:hypothetical protein CBR_g23872 [Chara braunii]|eukprot:GBG77423.1 hypothetical protein CBR_g23872 [Chara braunii]